MSAQAHYEAATGKETTEASDTPLTDAIFRRQQNDHQYINKVGNFDYCAAYGDLISEMERMERNFRKAIAKAAIVL